MRSIYRVNFSSTIAHFVASGRCSTSLSTTNSVSFLSRVLRKFFFQFDRQANSARLGRRMLADAPERSSRPRIHFAAQKPSMTSPTSPSDSCIKQEEDHQRIPNKRQVRSYSTNLSRSNRDQKLQILNSESNKDTRVPQARRSTVSRNYSIRD